MHGRKRPYTEKYDGLHVTVLRSYISVSFTEKYGDIRRKIRSFMVHVYDLRLTPCTIVSLRIRHGEIRSESCHMDSGKTRSFPTVFFSVYGRILSFTESVMFDLGTLLVLIILE